MSIQGPTPPGSPATRGLTNAGGPPRTVSIQANMDPQHQAGFAALLAVVQRGGLEELTHALKSRDDVGDGFLTPQDMRRILEAPTHVAYADYRRSYRIAPVARRIFQFTAEELDDLLTIAGRDPTGRKVHYQELLDLGASLVEVEGLKQLLSEGFVQILPQARDDNSPEIDDGGYSRSVIGAHLQHWVVKLPLISADFFDSLTISF